MKTSILIKKPAKWHLNIYNKSYSPWSSGINSNFKYFISTQKKWTGEEMYLKILIYVYDKNQENLYWKRATLLIKSRRRPYTEPTVLSNRNSTGPSSPTVLLIPHWPTVLFPTQRQTSPLSSPFTKWTRKIQTANSEVDFSINLKRGLMNIKKFNIYAQCSFPRKEQTHQTLSERGFFMDLCTLVEWELLYLRRHIYVI